MKDWQLDEKVRIWRMTALSPGAAWDRCLSVLTEEERLRASRMRKGVAQDEFVTARAALRTLLGQVLDLPPQRVELKTGKHGKPEVEGVWCNVAHSSGLIVLALCGAGEVGIDVEQVKEGVDVCEIAQDHFAPGERTLVLTADDPLDAFYEVWTRKEAAIKAVGCGLSVPLGSFDVSESERVLVGETPVYLTRVDLGPEWKCCVGTVAVQREIDAILEMDGRADKFFRKGI